MRFQIGSRVEVLSEKKTPSGAWRLAEVVSNNGDEYSVRYERHHGVSKGTIEWVKKDVVRPRPPPVKIVADWVVGDVAEVLDDGYWKVAVIQALDGEGFFIRILGSFDEFKVQKTSIRVRQAWKDNMWVVLDKNSMPFEDLICKALRRTVTQTSCASPTAQNWIDVQEDCSRPTKRASPDHSADPEMYSGNMQKKRAAEEDDRHGMEVPMYSSSLCKGADTAVCITDSQSQNNGHALCIDRKIALDQANSAEQISADFFNRILGQNYSPSIASSVCSCSAIRSSLLIDSLAVGSKGVDTLSSDAESCCRTGHEEGTRGLSLKKNYASQTHRSELRTYRVTLEALFASGPLSWELETYLTDLRVILHISADEHLAEVRKLRSFSSGLCVG